MKQKLLSWGKRKWPFSPPLAQLGEGRKCEWLYWHPPAKLENPENISGILHSGLLRSFGNFTFGIITFGIVLFWKSTQCPIFILCHQVLKLDVSLRIDLLPMHFLMQASLQASAVELKHVLQNYQMFCTFYSLIGLMGIDRYSSVSVLHLATLLCLTICRHL